MIIRLIRLSDYPVIRLSSRVCSMGYYENHDHFQTIQVMNIF